MGWLWRVDAQVAEVRLMFGRNRQSCRSRAAMAEHVDLLDILPQQRVEAQIRAKRRKIVSIRQACVISVLDDHIPTHKAHLKPKDCWVFTVIQ